MAQDKSQHSGAKSINAAINSVVPQRRAPARQAIQEM